MTIYGFRYKTCTRTHTKPIPVHMGMGFHRYGYGFLWNTPRLPVQFPTYLTGMFPSCSLWTSCQVIRPDTSALADHPDPYPQVFPALNSALGSSRVCSHGYSHL